MQTIFDNTFLKLCYALEKWIAVFENVKPFPEQLSTKPFIHNFTYNYL